MVILARGRCRLLLERLTCRSGEPLLPARYYFLVVISGKGRAETTNTTTGDCCPLVDRTCEHLLVVARDVPL